jgi:hypothetical protein
MKITLFAILVLCCFCSLSVMAQSQYGIKGTATDTASKIKLPNTSVIILNAKDSTLRAFARAGTDGSFAVTGLTKGKFILLLTYPGYADYVEHFALDSINSEHTFGNINLFLKSRLLNDVIIKGKKAAIKIKGDTTEFNASSYEIQPNDKVEDLLKQLPGIQVDKDGKITAQGQTVNKVLVDGEEFFGDDPTLVTKNIRADMVDKLQLYDKKSDQAAFTGIDDGKKTKVIDIKLKDNKKVGSFGKADLGAGTDGYYQGQLLFNTFKAKQKISAYGTLANTGKMGMGWQDSQKYGGGGDMEVDGDMIMFNMSQDDLESWDGRFNGEGKPVARAGGAHYDNKWDDDKQSINTNYKIGSLDVEGTKNILTQNNLPTGTFNTNSDQSFNNSIFRQKLDATYQVKLDTTSNLKLTADGTGKNSKTNNNYVTTNTRGNDVLLNNQTRSLTNDADQQLFNASALYTKKLKKVGRTFSASFKEAYNHSDAHGYLKSGINFYNDQGQLDSTQKIDQYKTNNITSNVITTNFTYTEPFTKAFSAIVNYGFGFDNSTADRKSFNQSGAGLYTDLDPSLSNNYKLNQISNQGGIIFNYKKKKSLVNFGSRVAAVSFDQTNEYTNVDFKRNFVNWMPQATYQYKFSTSASFRVEYNGKTTQPTIDQIQPLRVNTDPLNIVLGNPLLKPSFQNQVNVSYNSYKVLSESSLYLYGSYSATSSAIVYSTVTDSAGKTTNQAINLHNKQPKNFYLYAGYGQKIIGGFNAGLNFNINGNNSYNYTNSELNASKSVTYTGTVYLSKYKQKKYNFSIEAGPNYTISKTSLQSQLNNNGSGLTGRASASVYLPWKIQINSDVNYEYRAKTESFDTDFKRTLLNASISKAFLKQDNLKLVVSGNDLLNQNTGFNRQAFANQITQTNYTTIKRYIMFSIVYDFSKMGGPTTK